MKSNGNKTGSPTPRAGRLSHWLALLPVAFQMACSDPEPCPAYACVNSASMTGGVEVPSETTSVDVEFCNEKKCASGRIVLAATNETTCDAGQPGLLDDGTCITRKAQGELDVEAALTGPDNGKLPADGETYTLTITDHDSGEVLLDVTREADYEKTSEDSCHLCWRSEMTF